MFGTLVTGDFDAGTLEFVENPDHASAVSRNLQDKRHISCLFCRSRKVIAVNKIAVYHFLTNVNYRFDAPGDDKAARDALPWALSVFILRAIAVQRNRSS